MKKPIYSALLCSLILFFTACNSADDFNVVKTVTPVVTTGTWKVSLYMNSNTDQTNSFAGYTFAFNSSGSIIATKNGLDTEGSWSEDNIARKVTINFNTTEPALIKLNGSWNVAGINNAEVSFEKSGAGMLSITNL